LWEWNGKVVNREAVKKSREEKRPGEGKGGEGVNVLGTKIKVKSLHHFFLLSYQ